MKDSSSTSVGSVQAMQEARIHITGCGGFVGYQKKMNVPAYRGDTNKRESHTVSEPISICLNTKCWESVD